MKSPLHVFLDLVTFSIEVREKWSGKDTGRNFFDLTAMVLESSDAMILYYIIFRIWLSSLFIYYRT